MKSQALVPAAKPRVGRVQSIDFSTFLEKFGEKDRKGIARNLGLYEEKTGPEAASQWRRLACTLMTLAPYPARLLAQLGLVFYVPDGKYRKQVFGLEIRDAGVMDLYTVNVLAEASRAGILGKPRQEAGNTTYPLKGCDDGLVIAPLDGRTPDPADIFKAMTGWNRKAIRITIPAKASSVQIDAVEKICSLTAAQWQAELSQT
jgi:hypothetical protein